MGLSPTGCSALCWAHVQMFGGCSVCGRRRPSRNPCDSWRRYRDFGPTQIPGMSGTVSVQKPPYSSTSILTREDRSPRSLGARRSLARGGREAYSSRLSPLGLSSMTGSSWLLPRSWWQLAVLASQSRLVLIDRPGRLQVPARSGPPRPPRGLALAPRISLGLRPPPGTSEAARGCSPHPPARRE